MIKVIASDMDGTLLGEDHRVAPETLDAIHRAQAAGIRFMLATGRNYKGVLNALGDMKDRLTCDYLVSSGAEVRNPEHEVVSRMEIEPDLCGEIYRTLSRYPVSVIFCTDGDDYQIGTQEEIIESTIVHIKMFYSNLTDREEVINSEPFRRVMKTTKVVSSYEELRKLQIPVLKLFVFAEDTELLKRMGTELEKDGRIAVASSFITNLEITDVRAQKGPVLKSYIESLGYTMDEVMVFGDSLNDESMLSMDFGATIAMENADPLIKKTAKYITKSNAEFGVAYIIEELLKKREENVR